MFAIWHIAEVFIPAPASLPDLYTVINVLISCGIFTILFMYYVYRQFTVTSSAAADRKKTQ